jgi:predicted transcriptional regulator
LAAWFVVHEIVAVDEVVEVETVEIVTGFSTFTVVDAVEVLLDVSVESAQRVVEPLARAVVFQDMEYRVPLGVEVEPMRVLAAKVAPKLP